jgi:type I restriction-modification system DNA methylase subunit
LKSTWFASRQRYEFARLLQEADYGSHCYETFRIFLECAFAAVYQPAHKLRHGELDAKVEAEYMKSIGRVKHPNRMAEAMAVLIQGLEKDPHDFLGMVMMELGVNEVKFRGQCFTPRAVSRCMAEMTLADCKPVSGRTLMLNEPACGGGSMIIAASEVLQGLGFYPWHYCWVAVDTDWKCFAMTYIQTTLLGIPAGVIHGNSLSLETHRSEWNMIATLHPPKRRQGDDDPVNDWTDDAPEIIHAAELIPLQQLSLF